MADSLTVARVEDKAGAASYKYYIKTVVFHIRPQNVENIASRPLCLN
jgi:hypothetical protein